MSGPVTDDQIMQAAREALAPFGRSVEDLRVRRPPAAFRKDTDPIAVTAEFHGVPIHFGWKDMPTDTELHRGLSQMVADMKAFESQHGLTKH